MTAVASAQIFRRLRSGLRDAVTSGDQDGAQALVDGVHDDVMRALIAGDRGRLAELGGQAARLQNVVSSAAAEPGLSQVVLADLRRISRTAEIGWTAAAMQTSRTQPATPDSFTVREQVLLLLRAQPQRPRDLSTKIGVDRTQISRALQQLKRNGHAVQKKSVDQDKRAVYWHAV
jgi:hypothetical protein